MAETTIADNVPWDDTRLPGHGKLAMFQQLWPALHRQVLMAETTIADNVPWDDTGLSWNSTMFRFCQTYLPLHGQVQIAGFLITHSGLASCWTYITLHSLM
jgi:hypothetical protein